MIFLKKVHPKNSIARFDSWHMVMALAIIVVLTQGIASLHLIGVEVGGSLQWSRFLHVVMGFLSILTLLVFSRSWKSHYSKWLFYILFLPFYVTTWHSQVVYVKSTTLFAPLMPFKLYPIVLAFLVPGAYWVNFLMIIAFCIEALILWFYLDFAALANDMASNEPMVTILFACISFNLLYFRYRDEKIIRGLTRNRMNSEVYENLTRMFLSMRDRANSPLQVQVLITELIKKRHPEDKDLIQGMEQSVERLTAINHILGRFDTNLSMSSSENLMSEDEILKYLDSVEQETLKPLMT